MARLWSTMVVNHGLDVAKYITMLKAVYYDVVYVRLATTLQWPHSKHTHTHARTYILLLFMRNLRKWRTLQNLCLLRRHFNSLSIGR